VSKFKLDNIGGGSGIYDSMGLTGNGLECRKFSWTLN
jgi:hypothetical protein